MMWYRKYLDAFERPYQNIPNLIKKEVTRKLADLRTDNMPLCSVVLIAHNEEKRILACLWSLVDNICDFPIEIIVVSNNSTDLTNSILEELGVTWFSEEKKGPGFARQCGLNHAKGRYYICIDSDTLYPPHYISTHVSFLKRNGVVCTYGLWSFMPDDNHSYWGLKLYEFMRDCYLSLQNIRRPELCVRGMVMAFHTELGRKVGFHTNIIRGEDGMLAFGLKKYGKIILLKTRKVRPITCNSTMEGKGVWYNFWIRVKQVSENIALFFSFAKEYKDRDYNKIDKRIE